MRLAIHAISAKMGGATTYLNNALLPILRELEPVLRGPVILWGAIALDRLDLQGRRLELRTNAAASRGSFARLLFDQLALPAALARERVNLLFSTGNLGPLRPGCKQALLVRNAAPFSELYLSRMPSRRIRTRTRAIGRLTRWSAARAQVVIFPSAAMRDAAMGPAKRVDLHRPDPRLIVAPYGTRHDLFFPAPGPPRRPEREVRVLNVSYYSDQKNLGTMLKAALILSRRTPGRFRFDCTAGFEVPWLARAPQFPRFRAERALFSSLRDAGVCRDLGWLPHGKLPEVYRASDVFVFPSYVESFGHPLIEAMACGLHVVAADTPIHREICGDAAEYFDVFSAESLAEKLESVVERPGWRGRHSERSVERARGFTWEAHARRVVQGLLQAWRGDTPAPAW